MRCVVPLYDAAGKVTDGAQRIVRLMYDRKRHPFQIVFPHDGVSFSFVGIILAVNCVTSADGPLASETEIDISIADTSGVWDTLS